MKKCLSGSCPNFLTWNTLCPRLGLTPWAATFGYSPRIAGVVASIVPSGREFTLPPAENAMHRTHEHTT